MSTVDVLFHVRHAVCHVVCRHTSISLSNIGSPSTSENLYSNITQRFLWYVIHVSGKDLVLGLTGEELSGDAWISVLDEDVDLHLEKERKDYLASLDDAKKAGEMKEEEPDLNMTIRFVDGDVLISDSSENQKGVIHACREFEEYVTTKFLNKE